MTIKKVNIANKQHSMLQSPPPSSSSASMFQIVFEQVDYSNLASPGQASYDTENEKISVCRNDRYIPAEGTGQEAKFDLSLFTIENEYGDIELNIEYSEDKFSHTSMNLSLRQYKAASEQISRYGLEAPLHLLQQKCSQNELDIIFQAATGATTANKRSCTDNSSTNVNIHVYGSERTRIENGPSLMLLSNAVKKSVKNDNKIVVK